METEFITLVPALHRKLFEYDENHELRLIISMPRLRSASEIVKCKELYSQLTPITNYLPNNIKKETTKRIVKTNSKKLLDQKH